MSDYNSLAKYYLNRRLDKSRFDFNRDIEVPAMIKLIGDVKNKIILDMGCGFADHAMHLSKKGYKKLVGFDLSDGLISVAQAQNIRDASFYVGDMSKKLNHASSSFDIVYSSLAIHYVSNINFLFKEVSRVLKKGGVFCFSTIHPVFNLMNQSSEGLVGVRRRGVKKEVLGNYFDESSKPSDLGGLGFVNIHNYSFETLIKAGLSNGFELVDYVDARPLPSAKKYDVDKYNLTCTLPTFILFKFKKK
ncbi:MAG: class I SAM-dependent methyltransferase [Candidatus Woesearchaeota archaeon]